jgi:hypothetical protein
MHGRETSRLATALRGRRKEKEGEAAAQAKEKLSSANQSLASVADRRATPLLEAERPLIELASRMPPLDLPAPLMVLDRRAPEALGLLRPPSDALFVVFFLTICGDDDRFKQAYDESCVD